MSDLQPKGPKIELGGEEREMLFTLRAVDEIQDHFDAPVSEVIGMLADEEKIYKAVPFLAAVLVSEGSHGEKPVTEDDMKGWITVPMLAYVSAKIMRAYGIAVPEPDEDDDPNATSRNG